MSTFSANAGEGDARPQGPQRRARQVRWLAAHHQGRGDGGEGDRARRQVREHGRADGARSRLQDQRKGRRRHHDGDVARAVDRAGRREVRGRRNESDGSEARRRSRGRRGRERHREARQESTVLRRGGPGRNHLLKRRRGDRQDDRQRHAEGRQRGRHHRRRSQVARYGRRDRRRACSSTAAISRPISSPMPRK